MSAKSGTPGDRACSNNQMNGRLKKRNRALALVAATAALSVVAVGGVPIASSATVVQAGTEAGDVYSPRAVTVAKGRRVTWRFNGPHNVVGKGKGWTAKIRTSGTWSRAFRVKGKFYYRCTIHPGMKGSVTVR